ncbi:MAG: pseudouridine synthase [Candidatus Bathyarchaeota archaeon]|nr:pseudouridine synthase [Candidatus Bathyarchaeota archaeon]MDH5689729.1 pseudouridine synthase [Candidatus Bathyarchaeota archaeon]
MEQWLKYDVEEAAAVREKAYLLRKVRCVADYQFGKGAGEKLFPSDIVFVLSRRTGRVRLIYLNDELLATVRPTDGLLTLTVEGAERLIAAECSKNLLVVVEDDVSPFIERGRSVFAKHVVFASEEIRPGEEVIVVNSKSKVLAVGRAKLSGREMKFFDRGVAVQVRRGRAEKG